jgi:hypothetical protein
MANVGHSAGNINRFIQGYTQLKVISSIIFDDLAPEEITL